MCADFLQNILFLLYNGKKLLHDMNVNYKVVELDMLEYGSQFQDAFHKMTAERTVPRIFVNGTFIGGAPDTLGFTKKGNCFH